MPPSLSETYLDSLIVGDGDAAAATFHADGVLDDFLGGRHIGRSAIARFISGRPPLSCDIERLDRRIESLLAVYGTLEIGGRRLWVRWIFVQSENLLSGLIVSRVTGPN